MCTEMAALHTQYLKLIFFVYLYIYIHLFISFVTRYINRAVSPLGGELHLKQGLLKFDGTPHEVYVDAITKANKDLIGTF